MLLAGCAINKEINVMMPAEINLNAGSSLKVIAAPGEKNIQWLVEAVEKEIKKDKSLSLADADKADFYVVLSYKYKYAASNGYDKQVVKSSQKNGNITKTVHNQKNINTSSAAAFVQCTLYDNKNLAPVNYFYVAEYGDQVVEANVKSSAVYKKELAAAVIEEISKKLATTKRAIDVMRPMGGFNVEGICEAFDAGNAAKVKELSAKLPKPFDKFIEAVKKGEYKAELDDYLPDYYLVVIAQEFDDISVANLKKIRRQLSEIIKYTDKGNLEKSVANSISRIDKKLAILQGK